MAVDIKKSAEALGMSLEEYSSYLLLRIDALERKLQDIQVQNTLIEFRSVKIKAMINDEAFNKPIPNKVY